jgi:hypothetical protein
VLTLNAEGPSMAGDGKMAKYKDVIELKSDYQRRHELLPGPADGQIQLQVDCRADKLSIVVADPGIWDPRGPAEGHLRADPLPIARGPPVPPA